MDYKIVFPTGYNDVNQLNDNIDINIILSNGDVYWGTLFTIRNIQFLLQKEAGSCFWATNMLIVKDLRKETLREAIAETLEDKYFEKVFSKIGDIKKQYPGLTFDEISDMANGYDLNINYS